jgi:hypothetical protein
VKSVALRRRRRTYKTPRTQPARLLKPRRLDCKESKFMDQLKAAMAWLAKYHFWVLSGLAVLVGLVVWFLAVGDLEARYNSRKQKLDGDFQTMQGIQGEQQHPNDRVIQAAQAKHEELKKKVFDAWQILHKQQEDKNPWPDVLGQDFINFIKSQPPDAEILPRLREVYQNFIIQRFPRLLELIDVRRPKPGTKATEKTATAEAHGGESEAKATDFTGMVFWDEANLKGIQEPYKWGTLPSTLQVRMAQEDLWVYEALLRIIKNTNEGVRDYFKAPVRRIEAVEIAQAAAASFGRVGSASANFGSGEEAAGGGGAEGQPAAEPSAAPSGDPNAPAPGAVDQGGGAALDNISRNLLDRRYVDDKGKPLTAGSPHPYPEFKMMPIRLKLVMNQMQIPKLLAQCANSNMPVEVRQVRIRPDDSGRAPSAVAEPSAAPAPGAGGGAEGAPVGGAPVGAPDAAARGGSSEGPRGSDETGQSLYVPVEVLGIIYIYNPPDQAKLRPAAQPGEAAAGAAAPAPAGAEPAAGAAPAAAPPPGGAAPAPAAGAAPAPAAPAAAGPGGAPPGPGAAVPAAAPGGAK